MEVGENKVLLKIKKYYFKCSIVGCLGCDTYQRLYTIPKHTYSVYHVILSDLVSTLSPKGFNIIVVYLYRFDAAQPKK